MTTGALVFMAASWVFVLGLMTWSFWRVLRPKPKSSTAQRNGRLQR
ncbi:MAG: hypothetical protein ABJF88_13905 [Rhodothermales bacterium]